MGRTTATSDRLHPATTMGILVSRPTHPSVGDFFRSLPTELIVGIFVQRVALEIPPIRNEFYSHQSLESDGTLASLHYSVLTLAAVCSRWRTILMGTAYF